MGFPLIGMGRRAGPRDSGEHLAHPARPQGFPDEIRDAVLPRAMQAGFFHDNAPRLPGLGETEGRRSP